MKGIFYFYFASLAEASYSSLDDGKTLDGYIAALKDKSFSQTQAADILSRWSIKHHVPDTDSHFSMTLFVSKKSDGGYVLAFRGTQGAGDLGADVGDIVSDGLALDQIIDLPVPITTMPYH